MCCLLLAAAMEVVVVVVVVAAGGGGGAVQTRVTPKLFDNSVCSNASQLPVVTVFSSCPCFLRYHISSAEAQSSWDVMLLNSSSYVGWQRANFSGVPQFVAQYSVMNSSEHASGSVELQATNIFDGGLFALVIRASTNRTQCFGARNALQQQQWTEVVFEAMPNQCPIVSEESNASNVSKIVGGSVVNSANSAHSFGWMALIWEVRNARSRPICGGSQFRNGFIATAAHCLVHEAPQHYRVSMGATHADAQRSQLLRIQAAYAHPNYQTLASNEALYDVAVLQLLDAGNQHTIALNLDARTPAVGDFVTAAGFGYISEEWPALPVPNRLLRVDVPVVSHSRCARTFARVRAHVHLCAGYEAGGCDSCQADSGGPLRYVRHGRERLVGVVSFGAGCARAHAPGVYTRVSAVAPWMLQVAANASVAAGARRRARTLALAGGGALGALAVALLLTLLAARRCARASRRRAPHARSSRSDALSETGVSS